MTRVKIAGVVERLPPGTLQSAEPKRPPRTPTAESKPVGRPRKAPGTKARGLTVTLWPAELDALERLRGEVNAGLPAPVPRSDLARLAFRLLLELPPAALRERLARFRQ